MDNDIHECQCDGAGYCPVYKSPMTEHKYKQCKHDISWRKHYKKFYDTINSPSFQTEIEQRPEYKAMQKSIEALFEQQKKEHENKKKEHENQKKAYQEYGRQQQKKEIEYFKSLSPEKQEIYKHKRQQLINRRKRAMLAERAEQQQLREVVDNIEEEGVTPENYQENTEGLGDLISNALSKFGITEETIKKWSGTQEGCGCDKRKKFLNAILSFRKKE